MTLQPSFFGGKRVFLTGQTGFKGGWLSLWLAGLGAQVHGYALTPPTEPNLFTVARVVDHLASHTLADVRDLVALDAAMQKAQPEVVFHLAAQPLVRRSYAEPLETYAVNVMGTAHLLEAVRRCKSVVAVVNVTTDKCYENREWVWPYRENEALGGADPYSSSKACSELVTAAYHRSFLTEAGVRVATARAGNVLGGGDWAEDRLLPDCLRALDAGRPPLIRNPQAIRPWQHVLEPLLGYLRLAQVLCGAGGENFAQAWNFGPSETDAKPVQWIVDYILERQGQQAGPAIWHSDDKTQPHEAHTLKLDSTKAHVLLGWRPCWNLATALDHTLAWHQAWRDRADMAAVSLAQIRAYEADAQALEGKPHEHTL
jgi:CDP-glucose 4,6-dehydratase